MSTLHETLADIEREAILDRMSRLQGNKARTARSLGISRPCLDAKLKKYAEETLAQIAERRAM